FQFYVKDWLTDIDTLMLSNEERGVYVTMLSLSWLEDDTSLPANATAIAQALLAKAGVVEKLFSMFFTESGGRMYNEKLKNQKTKLNKLRRERAKYGHLGGVAKATAIATAEDKQKGKQTCGSSKKTLSPKRNKIKFLDFVLLTEEEHAKLIQKHGEQKLNRMLEKLNNHIGAKGDKYKSHYYVMNGWVAEWARENPEPSLSLPKTRDL
ncbi:MAG: DUF1376 domain-containing protein, partial [Candidatus Woesearchaeota archaeon]